MAATLDFGAYSTAEKHALLAAAKAEYLVRITGRISSASSANQSYGFVQMTTDDLIRLINGLSDSLGLIDGNNRVRPNFNARGSVYPSCGYGGPVSY